ncbi:ATP-binding protein [Cellulomonas phragmiteti]|uniref:histidine kinase n=1 Tax=Cellulomonas phragmiteti TaxID=478780 RepID=A0ABQ4DIY5_9CELL|nr:histidine kinase [Cellulomonas phragmiteti]GIG39302.1 hypothetical protein Cph01nite_10640 [Cellulomonas phragmiteti]
MSADGWRAWAPEGGGAVAVLLLGDLQAAQDARPAALLPVLGLAAAVLLVRRAPGASLAVVWVVAVAHVMIAVPVLGIEVAVAVVAFGCARWGGRATVVASGVSIPAAAGLAGILLAGGWYGFVGDVGILRDLVASASRVGNTVVGIALLWVLLLVLPWLAGFTLRAVARARRSEDSQAAAEQDALRAQRETAQAREIAQLREDQASLARDVHDVVGHSLAVILAQAESAQFLPDDPAALKATMATIATSARASLQDVRGVLSPTSPPVARPGGLDQLVEGVRASGHEVVSQQLGDPRPMPPELEVVAFHVLQEMLTNAIRHGTREAPVVVERRWPDGGAGQDLRIEVRNVEGGSPPDAPAPERAGRGIDGMRRRLESVGGRLEVGRGESPEGRTFIATAWVPVRARTA